MKAIRKFAWRLVLACATIAFSGHAVAQQLTPAYIAGLPNNACENLPPLTSVCPTCGNPVNDPASGYRQQGIGHSDCEIKQQEEKPIAVLNSMSQGVAAVPDSDAVSPGTMPGGCSSCGGGGTIPANTQLPHFELPRIWRSTWTHDGSFGRGMYSGYDYYVTYSSSLIEIRDPNTFMVLQRNYADGSHDSYTYNSFNEVTSHTDRLGHVEMWTYDGNGNELSHTVPGGTCGPATESWVYNAKGQVTQYSDFNGNSTGYAYYATSGTNGAAGDLQAIVLAGSAGSTQPSGTISLAFNGFGLVKSATDAVGRVVTFGFDAANRHVLTTYADSSSEVVNYQGSNPAQVSSTFDRNGNETEFTYYSSGGSTGLLHSVLVHQGTSATILSTTTKLYDPTTLMPTSVNADGNQRDMAYDYQNRVKATTMHPSAALALTSSNIFNRYRLVKSIDYYGRGTSYIDDNMDRPLSVIQELRPGGPSITTSTVYNAQGLVTGTIDGNGNRAKNYYDQRNRRVKATVAAGTRVAASTSVIYDQNSNVLTRIDERGHKWTNTYSVRNQVLSSADPLGDTAFYSYTADGLVLTATNANSHVTTNAYETCCARLHTQTDNDGNVKTFYYDPNGNQTQVVDEIGNTINAAFDGLNRQTLSVTASGSLSLTTSTAYFNPTSGTAMGGQSVTTTNPAGQVITTTLDGMSRTLSTTGNTAPVSYSYDHVVSGGPDSGLVMTAIVTGSGSIVLSTSALSDGGGRTLKTFDGLGNVSYMTFDYNGNMLTVTDQDDRVVTNVFDARNRMTSSQGNTGGIAATTSYSYDLTNNVTSVTDPESKVTIYMYNDANRRTSTTYAAGTADARTWSMTYKPLGQLATLAKPNGTNIAYSYENRELISSRTYLQGSGTLGTDLFTYAPNRLMLSASGGLYTMNVTRGTASYDAANRLTQETEAFGGLAKSMSYVYTPDSLVSQTIYPDGTAAARNYNDHRLLYQTLIGSTTQATLLYDAADRRSSLTYVNSAVTAWTLDANSRVTDLKLTAGTSTLQEWGYRYTAAGDPLAQNDLTPSFGTMGEAYQYDGLHRLDAYQRGTVSGSSSVVAFPAATQNWNLTAAGDWSAWTNTAGTASTTDTRTHNNIHALTNRTAVASPLGYDSNSNQTDDGTAYKLVYDANDQLREVRDRSTLALVASYAYDAFQRRTQKFGVSSSMTTNYFYAGQQVAQEYVNSAGTPSAFYTYGEYVDEPLTMDRSGSRYYYHANRLYNIYLLSNGSGGVAERYSYTPYGMVTAYSLNYSSSSSTSTLGNPYLYTGREFDPESSLYNYRARTYDPAQGRFKQLDPAGYEIGDENLYCYCASDPIDFADPSGLRLWRRRLARRFRRCCEPHVFRLPLPPYHGPTSRQRRDECCAEAEAREPTAWGMTICCDGFLTTCDASANQFGSYGMTNRKAQELASACVRWHEERHTEDLMCDPCRMGTDRHPLSKPGHPTGQGHLECPAWKETVKCLDAYEPIMCAGDPECQRQIKKLHDDAQETVKYFCDPNFKEPQTIPPDEPQPAFRLE